MGKNSCVFISWSTFYVVGVCNFFKKKVDNCKISIRKKYTTVAVKYVFGVYNIHTWYKIQKA